MKSAALRNLAQMNLHTLNAPRGGRNFQRASLRLRRPATRVFQTSESRAKSCPS
jgi:hypothetical protein